MRLLSAGTAGDSLHSGRNPPGRSLPPHLEVSWVGPACLSAGSAQELVLVLEPPILQRYVADTEAEPQLQAPLMTRVFLIVVALGRVSACLAGGNEFVSLPYEMSFADWRLPRAACTALHSHLVCALGTVIAALGECCIWSVV